jgi:hypothetical protein
VNFRTKDLMISVVPTDALNPSPNTLCRFATFTGCWRHTITVCGPICSWIPSVPPPHCRFLCSWQLSDIVQPCRQATIDLGPIDCTGTPYCAGSMTPWLERPTVEGINVLRDQLKARITELDDLQASFQEGPADLAEAETLEAHLKDALAQVQAKKAELKGAKK